MSGVVKGYGIGDGYGDGSGWGDGWGEGNGFGSGSGSGHGHGYGWGDGSGSGHGTGAMRHPMGRAFLNEIANKIGHRSKMLRLFRWITRQIFGTAAPESVASPVPPTSLPPELDGKVPQWEVIGAEWFTPADMDILISAINGLNTIAKHPRFKKEILGRTYLEDLGEGGQGVWNRLVSGQQLTPEDKPGVLDFKAVMYASRFSKVVGYTYLESISIWINRKFFSTPQYVASNIAHETTHQLGYTHQYSFDGTVPYQMNEIIEKLWDELKV